MPVTSDIALLTATDIIETIEFRYNMLSQKLSDIRETIEQDSIDSVSDKCFELSFELIRYKNYFSMLKKQILTKNKNINISLA